MKIFAYIVLCISTAVLYRLGGIGKPYDTKYRDLGCALCVLGILSIFQWHWSALVSCVLLFGSLTTYWTPKSYPNVLWWNWFLTGLMYGVSLLPYCYYTGHLKGGIFYIICLSFSTMFWSEIQDDVNYEEGGRGFLLTALLPLIFLP